MKIVFSLIINIQSSQLITKHQYTMFPTALKKSWASLVDSLRDPLKVRTAQISQTILWPALNVSFCWWFPSKKTCKKFHGLFASSRGQHLRRKLLCYTHSHRLQKDVKNKQIRFSLSFLLCLWTASHYTNSDAHLQIVKQIYQQHKPVNRILIIKKITMAKSNQRSANQLIPHSINGCNMLLQSRLQHVWNMKQGLFLPLLVALTLPIERETLVGIKTTYQQ